MALGLTSRELKLLRALSTPAKVQDFLNRIPFNDEPDGETCRSPRRVLDSGVAHCLEGAMLAGVAFRLQGRPALLMDLSATDEDDDHVVTLFGKPGAWGAVSKTGSSVLRYREPIYRNLRELALTYFHEYFTHAGVKTLRAYSNAVNLSRFDRLDWITTCEDLWEIANAIVAAPHHSLLTASQAAHLRKADTVEIQAGKILERIPPRKKFRGFRA
ncbi:MAG: hypothetical protein JO317_07495 [Verrucomicrobiae bacterium]|nr:hypothetical protein [Verrucomicrobiae bacterium]